MKEARFAMIALAPLEGLADADMRAGLTALAQTGEEGSGYDWAVAPFARVSKTALPERVFARVCPELLAQGQQGQMRGHTPAGTPVRAQLLGSDPTLLAECAARLVLMGAVGVDLNFGCPSPAVNRHGGGAALLAEPETLFRIAAALRQNIPRSVPRSVPFTAKMRLGISDNAQAVDCAQALQAGGMDALVVHGRTRQDGYRPPARWAAIARVREAVKIPVIANGEVWNVADYEAIRRVSGCEQVMLGRGAVADPLLIRRIRGLAAPKPSPDDWRLILPVLCDYRERAEKRLCVADAAGRVKQWLFYLRRAYPEADALYRTLRPLVETRAIDVALNAALDAALASAKEMTEAAGVPEMAGVAHVR